MKYLKTWESNASRGYRKLNAQEESDYVFNDDRETSLMYDWEIERIKDALKEYSLNFFYYNPTIGIVSDPNLCVDLQARHTSQSVWLRISKKDDDWFMIYFEKKWFDEKNNFVFKNGTFECDEIEGVINCINDNKQDFFKEIEATVNESIGEEKKYKVIDNKNPISQIIKDTTFLNLEDIERIYELLGDSIQKSLFHNVHEWVQSKELSMVEKGRCNLAVFVISDDLKFGFEKHIDDWYRLTFITKHISYKFICDELDGVEECLRDNLPDIIKDVSINESAYDVDNTIPGCREIQDSVEWERFKKNYLALPFSDSQKEELKKILDFEWLLVGSDKKTLHFHKETQTLVLSKREDDWYTLAKITNDKRLLLKRWICDEYESLVALLMSKHPY